MLNEWSRRTILAAAGGVLAAAIAGPALAQQPVALKWAHVYETSEPYHTWAVWAGEELAKRTDNRFTIEVFPASSLGKEVDINEAVGLGTVDIIYTGQLFAGRTYGPLAIGGSPFMFRDYGRWEQDRGSGGWGVLGRG
jgi:TRAP-type C4-dicarboxylate transport system substrate-binding protein